MSIGNKNKDHLKDHAGVELVTLVTAPTSDDPLRFWTGHPTENTLVNLYSFSEGEYLNPHPTGGGKWAGPYGGRPKLIRELAPAIQARLTLLSLSSVNSTMSSLRAWWRLFDAVEATSDSIGQTLARVETVGDLHSLHEAMAHRSNMETNCFWNFVSLANDTRKFCQPRLPILLWTAPMRGEPERHLISEDQAKALKILLKQDWEAVRRTWARHDAIRAAAQRRDAFVTDPEDAIRRGEQLPTLSNEEERLLKNWDYFHRIQQTTGLALPSGAQLLEDKDRIYLFNEGLELQVMRAILFPTVLEADIAYHVALMGSGWNPSTLGRIDASKLALLFEHPKNDSQSVLATEDEEEVTMESDKPRARGKTQYCIGLKKNKASPPVIVAAYLERTTPLREQLQRDCAAARADLVGLQETHADKEVIEQQFKRVQMLQEGIKSVWLYVNPKGDINWLDWKHWGRYPLNGKTVSYLSKAVNRLNEQRASRGEQPVAHVKPSDFRDIYARWVYTRTGGNILAVMIALGHSSFRPTGKYLDNNIFNAENDDHARRFMTHLLSELKQGRVDLTILAQLVRHGSLTPEMLERLDEYRRLMRSRLGVGCADPRHPPGHIAPDHRGGKLCGSQLCLRDCPNAKFLPESLDGIAMRVEELVVMSEHLPRETWLRGEFPSELGAGENLLVELYPPEAVASAREKWRGKIACGEHLVPDMGPLIHREVT